jgi:hypothetical protein
MYCKNSSPNLTQIAQCKKSPKWQKIAKKQKIAKMSKNRPNGKKSPKRVKIRPIWPPWLSRQKGDRSRDVRLCGGKAAHRGESNSMNDLQLE